MTAVPSSAGASAGPPGQVARRYWIESRQPLASLVLVAPVLAIYELGMLTLGPRAARNGADAWLRQTLDQLGFSQYLLLPALTLGILLAWHYLTRRPWRVSGTVVYGMVGECLLLAICLRLLLQLQGVLMETVAGSVKLDLAGTLGTTTGYLGAGTYEELLFRLLLLPPLAWGLQRLAIGPAISMIGAVLLTSLLFAVAHHVGPYGEPFAWFNFLFRLLAGVFFAVLFTYRGFGIAAGTHAGYDILVGLTRL